MFFRRVKRLLSLGLYARLPKIATPVSHITYYYVILMPATVAIKAVTTYVQLDINVDNFVVRDEIR